jgi:hypothetical protein
MKVVSEKSTKSECQDDSSESGRPEAWGSTGAYQPGMTLSRQVPEEIDPRRREYRECTGYEFINRSRHSSEEMNPRRRIW